MCDCGEPVQNNWSGDFCRCCGQPLEGDGQTMYHSDLESGCPYCERRVCGPHSVQAHNGMPARRFCELCSQLCRHNGECPEHGFLHA